MVRLLRFSYIQPLVALVALAASLANATPVVQSVDPEPVFAHFTSKADPNVGLRFVSDSGVCETTPGVHQMSGYIDVSTPGTNMSMVRMLLSALTGG